MAKDIPCPVEGCDHPPFQHEAALKSHLLYKHPGYSGEVATSPRAREVPIVEEDFAALLNKFKVRSPLALNIAENISHTGGGLVFEDPQKLFERLAAWSSEVPPGTRRLILEQWFAEKGIAIPSEVTKRAALKDEELKAEAKSSGEVKYVYDEQHKVVRMAKQGELGGTLEQAKELKKMVEESELIGKEPSFIQIEGGGWELNPKARITGTDLMAHQFMKDAQSKGEPLDPIEALAQAASKMKIYREMMGGGGQPPWLSDPVAFLSMMKGLSGEGEATAALRSQLTETQKAIQDLKDSQLRGTIEAQEKQLVAVNEKLGSVLTEMDNIKRGSAGKTEMDILHEVVSDALGFVKSELPALRGDIKAGLGAGGMGGVKTQEDKEKRKGDYRKALEADKEIEGLGRKLFFEES